MRARHSKQQRNRVWGKQGEFIASYRVKLKLLGLYLFLFLLLLLFTLLFSLSFLLCFLLLLLVLVRTSGASCSRRDGSDAHTVLLLGRETPWRRRNRSQWTGISQVSRRGA